MNCDLSNGVELEKNSVLMRERFTKNTGDEGSCTENTAHLQRPRSADVWGRVGHFTSDVGIQLQLKEGLCSQNRSYAEAAALPLSPAEPIRAFSC